MLAKQNRINTPADFRRIMRKGRRTTTNNLIVSVVKVSGASRFGFIVSKEVGNAVVRNAVKRQLREFAQRSITSRPTGVEVVIRARKGSADASITELVSGFSI